MLEDRAFVQPFMRSLSRKQHFFLAGSRFASSAGLPQPSRMDRYFIRAIRIYAATLATNNYSDEGRDELSLTFRRERLRQSRKRLSPGQARNARC
jgi:hypothetical protein